MLHLSLSVSLTLSHSCSLSPSCSPSLLILLIFIFVLVLVLVLVFIPYSSSFSVLYFSILFALRMQSIFSNSTTTTPACSSKAKDALDAAAQATESHRYSRKTRVNYKGHVERALKYTSELEDPEWKTALTAISVHTPTVLLAFIASKCEQSGYSFKTAEGIRSALKQYFEVTFGCQGDTWHCDEHNNWSGNPVFEATFNNYYRSLKNRDGRSGVSKQSLAISYSDMTRLMEHLQDRKTIQKETEGLCLLFQAFAATGFTLWTR